MSTDRRTFLKAGAALLASGAAGTSHGQGSLQSTADALLQGVRTGDAVLVVSYFGNPIAPSWCTLSRQRPEIVWIEDRAQALWPNSNPMGSWVVYSPRKLIGVPDGGVLVRHGDPLEEPVTEMRRSTD